jgi:Peptidase family C25
VPEMAVGRLPVRSVDEATTLVSKILLVNQIGFPASALLVSDITDNFNFELSSEQLKPILQPKLAIEEVQRGRLDESTAKARLLESLGRGQRFVNYYGHGSAELWRGNLLTTQDARNLTNPRLPVFVMMTCLNGYFHDASADSLAEALLKAERGGAVAVWTSSGLSLPYEQSLMSQAFYRALDGATLGEAAMRAKSSITNQDIRKTWILLGDPTMRVK